MQVLISRQLKKEMAGFRQSLSQKEFHYSEEMMALVTLVESRLEESFKNISETMDKKILESKAELKKKNKHLNELKLTSEKNELSWVKQKDEIRRQLQKNKRKVNDLLKSQQIYEKSSYLYRRKISQTIGTQCELQNEISQKMLQDSKKQNISLSETLFELQQIIRENKQDIEAANILIQELIKQLETNIADRQTGHGTDSQNASDIDSESIKSENQETQYFSDNQHQMSQHSATCRVREINQDCSTIDGSNATNKDFALPQWLQFDEEQYTPEDSLSEDIIEKSFKMWPQLAWNRFRQLIGYSYQL